MRIYNLRDLLQGSICRHAPKRSFVEIFLRRRWLRWLVFIQFIQSFLKGNFCCFQCQYSMIRFEFGRRDIFWIPRETMIPTDFVVPGGNNRDEDGKDTRWGLHIFLQGHFFERNLSWRLLNFWFLCNLSSWFTNCYTGGISMLILNSTKFTLVVSVSLWLHCFEPKLKQIPIPPSTSPVQATQSPFQEPSPRLKVRTEEEKSETAGNLWFLLAKLGVWGCLPCQDASGKWKFYGYSCPKEKRLPNGCRVFYDHPKDCWWYVTKNIFWTLKLWSAWTVIMIVAVLLHNQATHVGCFFILPVLL